MLNSGDVGLLRSLDTLSAGEASRAVNDGATIAAHAQHLRYGLSLMNQWASEGGDPFADARWDEAWHISSVDAATWNEIRNGLRTEAHRWLRKPKRSLDGEPPLSYLASEAGARLVEEMLYRIDSGILA